MLKEFIRKQESDTILLQEVTHTDSGKIREYTARLNVGVNNRGTAILSRKQISLTNITRLYSGRGMAAKYQWIWSVSIYVPSGTANRQEREDFYNVELVYLLRSLPPTMIVGKIPNSSCRRRTVSENELQQSARPTGVWLRTIWCVGNSLPQGHTYKVHPTRSGTSKVLYVSLSLRNSKICGQNMKSTVTDLVTVGLRINLDYHCYDEYGDDRHG